MNFGLLLVQNYDLFRLFDAHFVSGADHIAHTSKVPSCAFSGFWTLKLTQHFDLIYDIGKSDLNILRNIIITAKDSYTITIKQIYMFQERMHLEKFQVDKIQNGHPSPLFTSTGLILRNIKNTLITPHKIA